jgi:hypothetical protein
MHSEKGRLLIVIRYVMKKYYDDKEQYQWYDWKKRSPLHWAVDGNKADIVSYLLTQVNAYHSRCKSSKRFLNAILLMRMMKDYQHTITL